RRRPGRLSSTRATSARSCSPSSVCTARSRRRRPPYPCCPCSGAGSADVAELVFFCGTMDCGKSTLALQTDHNHAARGRHGLICTKLDRAGESLLSSRLGLSVPAVEVTDGLDLWEVVVRRRTSGEPVDYLICDEVQFYSPEQVEQLARL